MRLLLTTLLLSLCLQSSAQQFPPLWDFPPDTIARSPGLLLEQSARLRNQGVTWLLVGSGLGGLMFAFSPPKGEDSEVQRTIALTTIFIGGGVCIWLNVNGNYKQQKAGRLMYEQRMGL
jgi:hypothetical protein